MNSSPIDLTLDYLTEKGFARGTKDDKTYEMMGALPGETVIAAPFKKRRGVIRSNVESIQEASPFRIPSEEPWYSSSSPLQIADYEFEKNWKKEWIQEQFKKNNIVLPRFLLRDPPQLYEYRNKVEFAFYSDDSGLHLAVHTRGTAKGKMIATGSRLVPDSVNKTANQILTFLQSYNWEARKLKGLLIRYSFTNNKCVAAVFCKEKDIATSYLQQLSSLLNDNLQGLLWVYSDPKAPDNRVTEIQQELGDTNVEEIIGNIKYTYPWDGFFQVNPKVFQYTLNDIRSVVQSCPNHNTINVLDLYAGVGTIGLGIADLVKKVHGVEVHGKSEHYAMQNARQNDIKNFSFTQISTDNVMLEEVNGYDLIVVDPPRSGLMPNTLKLIKQAKPQFILYLSCNPATQANNISNLLDNYTINTYTAYNYYPRTMHVEALAVLSKIN